MHGRNAIGSWQGFQTAEYWKNHQLDELLAILDGKQSVSAEMCHAAYLALIGFEPIEQRFLIPHLQKYAASMNFTYHDERGNAFAYAASLGKDEILVCSKAMWNTSIMYPCSTALILFSQSLRTAGWKRYRCWSGQKKKGALAGRWRCEMPTVNLLP